MKELYLDTVLIVQIALAVVWLFALFSQISYQAYRWVTNKPLQLLWRNFFAPKVTFSGIESEGIGYLVWILIIGGMYSFFFTYAWPLVCFAAALIYFLYHLRRRFRARSNLADKEA